MSQGSENELGQNSLEALPLTVEMVDRDPGVGPIDAADLSELPTEGYADLGIVRVRPIAGMQVNMPASGDRHAPVAFLAANSALEVTVFAVPRDEDGRKHRIESIISAYSLTEVEISLKPSRYGSDLFIKTPITTPDGRIGMGVSRMILVSGDRWLAQLVIHGDAVDAESKVAKIFDDFIDSMIIVRGNYPAGPYSILLPTAPSSTTGGVTDAL